MPGAAALEKKASYLKRLHSLTQEFSKILIVNADNVRSSQMQRIRLALRGKAEVLFGKNTLIRNGLKKFVGENPALEVLIPLMRGNVGYIFTNADLKEIKDIIGSERVGAPARAGAVAPVDVWVPAGNTGIEPTQTAFFQALNIPTKISKGAIEILKDVQVVFKDTKVGASEATLLQKLNIQPFTYGLETEMVYDNGEVYSAAVLDLSEEDLLEYFSEAVNKVACLSLGTGHGTLASAPHNFVEAYKNVLALAIGTEQTFPLGEKVITLALDPEAAAAAAAAASAAAAPAAAGGGEAAKDEPEEEEDEDMGFGLFD